MPLYSTTTTAQNIMDAVSREVRSVLSSAITPDSSILLDYINRVCLELFRASRWEFLQSAPMHFITQRGQTDYWVGVTGSNPAGTVDTGLNLSDFRHVLAGTVFDRTNFVPLGEAQNAPLAPKVAYPDDTSRQGRPAQWRQGVDTPQTINIYPAADNQSLYQPQPETPICVSVAGGGLANRTYFVTATFVDSAGNESTAPFPAEVFVPAGFLLKVKAPVEPYPGSSTGIRYNQWRVYATQAANNASIVGSSSLYQQNGGVALSTATDFTESVGGLAINTPAPPTFNALEPIDGYIIEFKYFRNRVQVTTGAQVLQIPDDYKDVVIAGVTYKVFHYLFRPTEAGQWYQLYQMGVQGMTRDKNLDRSREFVRPDGATIGGRLPAVESIDLSVLQN